MKIKIIYLLLVTTILLPSLAVAMEEQTNEKESEELEKMVKENTEKIKALYKKEEEADKKIKKLEALDKQAELKLKQLNIAGEITQQYVAPANADTNEVVFVNFPDLIQSTEFGERLKDPQEEKSNLSIAQTKDSLIKQIKSLLPEDAMSEEAEKLLGDSKVTGAEINDLIKKMKQPYYTAQSNEIIFMATIKEFPEDIQQNKQPQPLDNSVLQKKSSDPKLINRIPTPKKNSYPWPFTIGVAAVAGWTLGIAFYLCKEQVEAHWGIRKRA